MLKRHLSIDLPLASLESLEVAGLCCVPRGKGTVSAWLPSVSPCRGLLSEHRVVSLSTRWLQYAPYLHCSHATIHYFYSILHTLIMTEESVSRKDRTWQGLVGGGNINPLPSSRPAPTWRPHSDRRSIWTKRQRTDAHVWRWATTCPPHTPPSKTRASLVGGAGDAGVQGKRPNYSEKLKMCRREFQHRCSARAVFFELSVNTNWVTISGSKLGWKSSVISLTFFLGEVWYYSWKEAKMEEVLFSSPFSFILE